MHSIQHQSKKLYKFWTMRCDTEPKFGTTANWNKTFHNLQNLAQLHQVFFLYFNQLQLKFNLKLFIIQGCEYGDKQASCESWMCDDPYYQQQGLCCATCSQLTPTTTTTTTTTMTKTTISPSTSTTEPVSGLLIQCSLSHFVMFTGIAGIMWFKICYFTSVSFYVKLVATRAMRR